MNIFIVIRYLISPEFPFVVRATSINSKTRLFFKQQLPRVVSWFIVQMHLAPYSFQLIVSWLVHWNVGVCFSSPEAIIMQHSKPFENDNSKCRCTTLFALIATSLSIWKLHPLKAFIISLEKVQHFIRIDECKNVEESVLRKLSIHKKCSWCI